MNGSERAYPWEVTTDRSEEWISLYVTRLDNGAQLQLEGSSPAPTLRWGAGPLVVYAPEFASEFVELLCSVAAAIEAK